MIVQNPIGEELAKRLPLVFHRLTVIVLVIVAGVLAYHGDHDAWGWFLAVAFLIS